MKKFLGAAPLIAESEIFFLTSAIAQARAYLNRTVPHSLINI
ncbi:hypothetical protein ACN23B_25455 [Anabaena sp. FACHB-709]|nr:MULTISPECIES: hypothetical protein [Nostocaceae]